MEREKISYGMISLGEDVIVSDPCYNVDTWCNLRLKMKAGKYITRADRVDCRDWGYRIASLYVFHEDYKGVFPDRLISNQIGVDSGQCGIYDYAKFDKVKSDRKLNDAFYDAVCEKTLGENDGGLYKKWGVTSSSGFGDGGYSLYGGFNENGECVSLEVVFITDEDIDDDDNDE